MRNIFALALFVGISTCSSTALAADDLLAEPAPADAATSPLESYESWQNCDACDACCDSCCDGCRLLGMLPSDHCFDDFISPLSNPFFFEDPRSLTEARAIFLENWLPGDIGGGDAQVYALQLRGRLTERLSVIAPRIGYLNVNDGGGGGGPKGFMSSPVGVKYNFLRDVDAQFLATGGITYFIPENLSNFPLPSDGDFHFFLTGGKQIYERGHWLSATGFRIPANNNWGTQLWYWSNQWDYQLGNGWYPLAGVNWFHWMRSANVGVGGPVTGLDLVNVPAGNVAGNDVVTGVAGLKWKPSGIFEVGTGYEFPLTDREDILRSRLYADVIFRY